MPFRPGEKPVQPNAPGRSKQMVKAMSNIALAVRHAVPAEHMVRWHVLLASGKAPMLVMSASGEIESVEAEPNGFTPTLDQRTKAIQWLADRGHGQAAQMIHLEAELKSQINLGPALPVRDLAPSAALAIAGLLRQRQQSQRILDVPVLVDELQLAEREPALETSEASAEPDGDAEG